MLQHEKTFKEQVHDLHKLYEVQRLLMDKAKIRGRDAYSGAPPPSPGHGMVVSEGTKQGQSTNFWEQAMPDGMGMVYKGGTSTRTLGDSPSKIVSERTIKVDETPKSVSSPMRKKKIDLEQPPEDDSDDEVETSMNSLNCTASCLSRNSKEVPKVYSGFDAPVKQDRGSHIGSTSQLLPPASNPSKASSFLSSEFNLCRGENIVKAPPSLSSSVPKAEQSFTSFGERNMSFQNASMVINGVGALKSDTMFLPQEDLIDRASQETGRQTHWFLQASEPNIVDTSVRFPAQQQQRLSPHLALPEHATSRSHPLTPHSEQKHLNNKSPWIESVGSSMGKISLERHSPGVSSEAQNDGPGVLGERFGDASNWFLKEPSSQGAPTNIVPIPRFEVGVTAEGGHGMPEMIGPAIIAASNKGLSQEHDVSSWCFKNPILQASRCQQPPVFQQHIVPPVGHSVWVQSSQKAQNSMYPQQQVVYGNYSSDPSQGGYGGQSLQKYQGEVAGSWNMIGLGHYYSSIPSPSLKAPFKKPPKLVLKNDGAGMELKLVLPEKEINDKEKAMLKKPLNSVKRDLPLASYKSCEINSRVQKQVGEEVNKLSITMSQIDNLKGEAKGLSKSVGVFIEPITGEAKGLSNSVGVSIEPTRLATVSASSTLALSKGPSTSVPIPCVDQTNLGPLAYTSGSETGSGFNLSASSSASMHQQSVLQFETVLPRLESEKVAEQRNSNPKTPRATAEKETLVLTNVGTKDMSYQMEGGSLSKVEIDMNTGLGAIALDKIATSANNATDVVVSSQSESFNKTPERAQTKCLEEGVGATEMVHQRAQTPDEDKGNLSQQWADAEVYQKDIPECNAFCNADSVCPAGQPVMLTVSVQSTSTDAPSTSRQGKKRSSFPSDTDILRRVSGRISGTCKAESGSPLSDRDCPSAPSSTTSVSEGKSEAVCGGEDLQHDSDSDNLAATILLSFAPKVDLFNQEKQCKDSASEISSSICKGKSADQGSKVIRSSEDQIGPPSDFRNTAGSQGRRMQNTGCTRRMERKADHHDHSKAVVKERHRREEVNKRWACEDDFHTKSLTIKVPRMASSISNDGAIPISRSKQLSKLNGMSLGGSSVEPIKNPHKGNEAVHTPTGRRSSRGPPTGARAPLENRSRLYQQIQHHVERSPPPLNKDSGIREEGVRSINKLEGNVKSKAWGELNRTRSHQPRKQFLEVSHRKFQK
ncbi:hypothetical protein L7F22_007375 [Adiantum nelumboides]|nr:hypothetical protein [Adiantum nelumboides]